MVGLTMAQLDTLENMQGVCESCGRKKTSAEGNYFQGHNVECPWRTEDVERLRGLPSAPPPDANVPRRIELQRDSERRGNQNPDRPGPKDSFNTRRAWDDWRMPGW
jgi:hypothetical protein